MTKWVHNPFWKDFPLLHHAIGRMDFKDEGRLSSGPGFGDQFGGWGTVVRLVAENRSQVLAEMNESNFKQLIKEIETVQFIAENAAEMFQNAAKQIKATLESIDVEQNRPAPTSNLP